MPVVLLIVAIQDLVLLTLVVEEPLSPLALRLLYHILVRVLDEVVVHLEDLFHLTSLVVRAHGNDLGDAALVEELLSKVRQLPDQLPQRVVQLALVRGGGDEERLPSRFTFDDRLDHSSLLALNGVAQGGLLV